jgi:hypothetical protein
MREIQDATLDVAAGTRRVTERLAEIAASVQAFEKYLTDLFASESKPTDSGWIAIGAVAVPMDRVSIRSFLQRYDLPAGSLQFKATKGSLPQISIAFPIRALNSFQPRLRAAVAHGSNESLPSEIGYAADGSLWSFCGIHEHRRRGHSTNILYIGWLVGMAANMLSRIEEVRKMAASPDLQFAMKVFLRPRGDWQLGDYSEWGEGNAPLPLREFVNFEPYEIGSQEEFSRIIGIFEQDLLNLCGDRAGHQISLSFS